MEEKERFKQLMNDKGWTVEDVAHLTGKNIKTIYNILSGDSVFPGYLLIALEIHEGGKHILSGYIENQRVARKLDKLKTAQYLRKELFGI